MGSSEFNRFLGWVFIGGLVTMLAAMVVMMALGWDTYTITWLTVVTGTVVGMTGGMVVLIRSFMDGEVDGSSS